MGSLEDRKEKHRLRAVEYRAKNAERLRAYARNRARQIRVEEPGMLRDKLKEWRRKNPDKVASQQRRAAERRHAAGIEYGRRTRASPEYKARMQEWRQRPENLILIRIRTRFKRTMRSAFKGTLSSRSRDADAVRFLLWSAEKRGIDPRDGKHWHVDHVRPASAFARDEAGINEPENLRWTSAKENLVKNDRAPTEEEIKDAREHAMEWRKSISQI